jgi:hypothetical protein
MWDDDAQKVRNINALFYRVWRDDAQMMRK